jgi:hypothetical protein
MPSTWPASTVVSSNRTGAMTGHRSRLCHFVVDVDDLDKGVAFWSAALSAEEEPVSQEADMSIDSYACQSPRSDY